MMYSTTNEPTATIHARILSRHESPAALENKQLHGHYHTDNGHTHIVHFQYIDEDGTITHKAFDGMHWSV